MTVRFESVRTGGSRVNKAVYPHMTQLEFDFPVYMHAAGQLEQNAIDRPEGFPHFQLLQCVRGSGSVEVEDRRYDIGVGNSVFLYPNQPHRYCPIEEPWEIHWLVFGGYEVGRIAELIGLSRSGVYETGQPDVIVQHIKRLTEIGEPSRPYAGLECAKLTYILLIDLFYGLNSRELEFEIHNPKLRQVLDYLDLHYNKVVTLEEIAGIADCTPQYICHMFNRILHTRPIEYLNRLRIRKSKQLMVTDPERTINDIGFMVGFETPGYFTKIFKRYEGMTPETFRRIHRL